MMLFFGGKMCNCIVLLKLDKIFKWLRRFDKRMDIIMANQADLDAALAEVNNKVASIVSALDPLAPAIAKVQADVNKLLQQIANGADFQAEVDALKASSASLDNVSSSISSAVSAVNAIDQQVPE